MTARSDASDPMLPLGTNRSRCMACGRYFSTVSNFDKHQRIRKDGRPECRDPETVGLVLGDAGYWQGPSVDMPFFASMDSEDATEGVAVVSGDISPQRTLF